MANPQLEKGYTRIANEITEALVRSSLSSAQIRVTLWVIRLSYGFQRKEFVTNVNAFAVKLKTTSTYIKQVFHDLEKFSVITIEWASPEVCKIIFNKDLDKWGCFL